MKNGLYIGDLYGNRFSLAIRFIKEEDDIIIKSILTILLLLLLLLFKIDLENVRSNGFINYYGLQRFGNASVNLSYII